MRRILSILVALLFAIPVVNVAADKDDRRSTLPDATIKTLVEHRLIKEGVLRDNNIQVSVDDHVVTLTGKVRSHAERQRAEARARSVDDVNSVINRLEVAAPDRADAQIAADIAKEIRSFVFFDIFDWVEGEVKDGVVTLKGAVRESWRRSDYERLAETVEGVKEVRNEIRVLPVSILDDEIRVAVARQIYGDPMFARYANRSLPPIHIIVENGRVTLKGAVATPLERQVVESKVRSGVLAMDVMNDLKVESQVKG
ncbi:MAG TPA: BON domain-containing protein [Blastocatellia bacterium]|nr:BON domain-containing protein [Blastocatellia bacterium]